MTNSIQHTLIFCLLAFSCKLCSQSVGIGTTTPDSSAILDITSTERGLLIPRMTTSQRIAAGAITTGLFVFDSTSSTFWFAENGNWTELKSQWIRNGNAIHNANPGNVGIGILNPTVSLDVLGSIKSTQPETSPGGSYISMSSPGNDPGIILTRGNGTGGVARRWDLKIDNDLSFRINDNTANTVRLGITTGGKMAVGAAVPHVSAALDIQSTTKGFLPPRLTFAQRHAITSPAEGLLIWCSDCGLYGEVQVYNGSIWTNMVGDTASGTHIGDFFQGGRVAYIFQQYEPGYVEGEVHGIIVGENDVFPFTGWGCWGTNLPGCEGTGLGTGNQNTLDIVNGCAETGTAGRFCYDLVFNGYDDWFLPSADELVKVYDHRALIGDFLEEIYWSSSEINDNYAFGVDFVSGNLTISHKATFLYPLRPVRYF